MKYERLDQLFNELLSGCDRLVTRTGTRLAGYECARWEKMALV